MMLLRSILSIIYSAVRQGERTAEESVRQMERGKHVGGKFKKERRGAGVRVRSMRGGGEREEKHFRGVRADQYNSTAISMANSLCCIQFTLFPRPQTQFTAAANGALCHP